MNEKKDYQSLLDKLNDWLTDVEQHEIKDLAEGVDFLKDWANTGIAVNREDIEQNLSWLKRDLLTFYQQYQHDVNESPFYLGVKDKLWHVLAEMTDKTQLEWRSLHNDFIHDGIYHSGEEVAVGSIKCQHCGSQLVIEHVQQLHDCSSCGNKTFVRQSSQP